MTEFLPSAHGLRFTNSWPDQALLTVGVPGLAEVAIGNASRGLCGGMVFTALDVFSAGLAPLTDGRPPPGSPLYRYLVKRLFDSFNLPTGVLGYYRSMVLADGPAGRSAVRSWPCVKADLDDGIPCPLGLVTVRSPNPVALGQNHQVLVYGYRQRGHRVVLDVYDPNTEADGADGVQLSVTLGPAGPAGAISHNLNLDRPVRGFFRVRYRPADPSGL